MPAPASIPVDVIMRSNFRETRGGDVAQIENSLAPLGKRVDVRYVAATAGMALRPGAIHHIVNVDRPLDFLAALDQCGDRVIVSTIHHAVPRIMAMQRAVGDDRKASFLPPSLRERLAFAVRASSGSPSDRKIAAVARILRTGLTPGDMWRRVGQALDRVDHVALLAEAEREDLIADTGWHGRNGIVIPNGRPAKPDNVEPWLRRSRGVIMVGRIEPRKRQLDIAKAAAARSTPVTFIGPVTDDSYGRQFRECVAQFPVIEWLGPCSASDTVALIATSRVLLNPSWVEVQSLVDIEAATAGCWVVTSPTGSSEEWLGGAVQRIDSDEPDILLDHADRLAKGHIAPSSTKYVHDWQTTGDMLFTLYSALSH